MGRVWVESALINLLMPFPVKHTSALDRAVVDITSSRFPARAGLTALGGGLTALDRNVAENLRSLPREGPRQGQRA
jgi:hypothetical protein